jgi:ubiquinone/menaquinone biosynthesis C-methylase UbiE
VKKDMAKKLLKIDLGCGRKCKQGYEGLDYIKFDNNVKYVVDLNKGILPFANNSVDEFTETGVLNELNDPMKIIEECYRCLKKGGTLEIREMYFASPLAGQPLVRNFWSFNATRIFTEEDRGRKWNWEIEKTDFETGFLPPRWLVNMNKWIYEKYISRILPINLVIIKLKKK